MPLSHRLRMVLVFIIAKIGRGVIRGGITRRLSRRHFESVPSTLLCRLVSEYDVPLAISDGAHNIKVTISWS
ncbi:hypothetical protein ASPBRDRAFT_570108 [Aspergillus brasiliensis CBS 101740]|uniref:Uncharacterized protein n=1 Tax=Aspergillus brasiliensis (strain CBS 101740 / IMI 381727 / IBT 21946) TaxID=767769 RepID=A0A1L9UJ07_ASPBC|nr:hypothetical protein ASPBRDRAFT_570108 [Aspergillus brasiliensis CBS 101740]